MEKEYNDVKEEEVLNLMAKWMSLDGECFIKWTCGACNERVTCSTPNAFFTEGWFHEEKSDGTKCNFTSYPDGYGLLVVKKFGEQQT